MQPRYVELSRAATVDEILQVTRDYLATWTDDDLEGLPVACRPAAEVVRGPDDIEAWADRLCDEAPRAVMLHDHERNLHRLTSHFLIASVRMRQIGAAT